jgi:hypothetical protein
VGGVICHLGITTHPKRQTVLSALKLLFEETSDFRNLTNALAQHPLGGKNIGVPYPLKKKQKPLVWHIFDFRDIMWKKRL